MKDTIIDSFLEVVERFPQKEALLYQSGHHFESLTYADLYKYAEKLAVYLKELGIKEEDKIVLISENRPEWVIVDIASMLLGAVLVPIHSVLSAYQMESIISEVAPNVIFVSGKNILEKVFAVEEDTKKQYQIGYFNTDLTKSNLILKSKRIFLFKEEVYEAEYSKKIEPVKQKSNRVITIIYTSGTTGRFKGVMLTNKNITSNITGVLQMVEVTEKDKFLSILPMSHIFERTVGYYLPLLLGATVSYIEDPVKLAETAAIERPTIILAVPRLYEKVYSAVKEKANKNILKRTLFVASFYIGKKFPKNNLLYKLANKIVFKKIKAAFGGQIRFFVSGAASLTQEIGEFFDALSIPILEGYGLTETSPIVSCNTLEKKKYGTIGLLLPNMEAKFVKNELWLKGPSVMKGYYKNPEKTKEAITKDGWFKTGDLVEIDSEGFLKFKAREKEIIALSTGKKVSPASLEEKMELCPCVSQAFVFGDNQKHISALIVPEKEKTKGLNREEVLEKIQNEINENLNKFVAHYEQIKNFTLISEPFTVENGLLTPTLKLRRKEISEKYEKEIKIIYKD